MIYTLIILFISAFLFGTGSIPVYTQTYAQEQLQTQEPAETEQAPVLTDKPVEIWTFIDDYRIITGKILHVTVFLQAKVHSCSWALSSLPRYLRVSPLFQPELFHFHPNFLVLFLKHLEYRE